jgi:putative membrane protein
MRLSPAESEAIDRLIEAVETRTGVQVLVAVVPRSDSYAELPWKAFALGAALAGAAVVLGNAWLTALLDTLIILGTGAVCALLAVFVPPFARLFLREVRSHAEVKQYAESLFFRRELFRTRDRTAVLLLVSQFERRIEILPDTGLAGRVHDTDWHQVVEAMTPHLRDARPFHAVEDGIAAVERVLLAKGVQATVSTTNELPNRPLQEEPGA